MERKAVKQKRVPIIKKAEFHAYFGSQEYLKGRVHFPDPLFLWYQCVPLTLLYLRNYRDFQIRPFLTHNLCAKVAPAGSICY